MILEQTKIEVLEKRIDYIANFYVSMKKQDIPERVLNIFRLKDRDFIYDFCYKVDLEPEPYIKMYDERTR